MTTPPASNAVSDEPAPPPKRSAAQIEADLDRTRDELTRTVDELSDRVDPRPHVARATEKAKTAATSFADDLKAREPRAFAILGGVIAAVAGVIVVSRRKR